MLFDLNIDLFGDLTGDLRLYLIFNTRSVNNRSQSLCLEPRTMFLTPAYSTQVHLLQFFHDLAFDLAFDIDFH